MRKKGLLVLGMSLALVLGNGITANAAAGWAMEDGKWVYYDNSGYKVTNEWKKGADNQWRYLNSNGQMAVDCWVDETYYVDSNGIMLTSGWQNLGSDYNGATDGNHWYYFTESGKAVMNTWKKINDKWYRFDWDGAMRTGWLDENMYYANDDGAAVVGWHKLYPPEDENEDSNPFEDDEKRWYYFSSTGKKFVPDLSGNASCGERKIDGNYYCFNDHGAMQTGWTYMGEGNTDSAIDGYRFYDNSGRAVTGWYSAYPPREVRGYDDEVVWFYFSNSGIPKTGPSEGTASTKDFYKINGKTYLFNEYGNPVTGLQKIYINESAEEYTSCYFDENSCTIVTGKVTIEEGDGSRSPYYFSANGRGFTGVQGSYLYYLGKQQESEGNTKYEIITITGDNGKSTNYLLNDSGKVVKSASGVKDDDGVKYSTNSSGVVTKINGEAVAAGATFHLPQEPAWKQ